MKIDFFDVEAWMTEHEKDYRYNLAETCVDSMNVNDLLKMVEDKDAVINDLLNTKLDYGPIEGSKRLRKAIAKLYETGDLDNISISHGCINANELVLISLLEKGDHLISITPTYQQMYSFPESFGVETDLVELKEGNDWLPDLDDFKRAIKDNTKMICLVNPNNPTSTMFSKEFLMSKYDEILEFSELGQFIDVPIKNYSSGMQARLGFSIATVVEPEILILDEVLSVGDAKFRKKCEKKMKKMFDHGVTVLFVSHSLAQVKRLCNKAIILEHGQLIAKGDIDDVVEIYEKKIDD